MSRYRTERIAFDEECVTGASGRGLEVRNLSVGYDGNVLLSGLCFELCPGCLTALLGRNGSGKSTLMKVLSGVSKPLSGHVSVGGVPVSKMKPSEIATKIAFVNTERIRVSNLKCSDVVALGRAPYTDWIGRLSERDREIVSNAMETVGMSAYANRSMDKMSDGECQRIMIARALAQDTPVILLDEPTSFLDYPGRKETVALLKSLASEMGKTILFSTHDIELVAGSIDSALILDPPSGFKASPERLVNDGILKRLFGVTL